MDGIEIKEEWFYLFVGLIILGAMFILAPPQSYNNNKNNINNYAHVMNQILPNTKQNILYPCEIEYNVTNYQDYFVGKDTGLVCHRCKNTSLSIMPGILQPGDWICPE